MLEKSEVKVLHARKQFMFYIIQTIRYPNFPCSNHNQTARERVQQKMHSNISQQIIVLMARMKS
jgi:hypothetical protein